VANSNRPAGGLIAAALSAFSVVVLVSSAASAAQPEIHAFLGRALVSRSVELDSVAGNSLLRLERFSNTGSAPLRIDALTAIALSPDDLGFADITGEQPPALPAGNVLLVKDTAAAAYPDYGLFGLLWQVNGDVPPYQWTAIEYDKTLAFPLVLEPGGTFDAAIRYRSSAMGGTTADVASVGEIVVGYRLTGAVVPEPRVAILVIPAIGLFLRRRS